MFPRVHNVLGWDGALRYLVLHSVVLIPICYMDMLMDRIVHSDYSCTYLAFVDISLTLL